MESTERLKRLIAYSNYSARNFCREARIGSLASYSSYLTGKISLCDISLERAARMFAVLDDTLNNFYGENFPNLKTEVDEKRKEWEAEQSKDMFFPNVWKRYYLRIAKMKERKTIPSDELGNIQEFFRSTFVDIERTLPDDGIISDEVRKTLLKPLDKRLKGYNKFVPFENESARYLQNIVEESDYIWKDVATIIDVSPRRLTQCNKEGYQTLNAGSAFKLCYLLGVDIDEFAKFFLDEE